MSNKRNIIYDMWGQMRAQYETGKSGVKSTQPPHTNSTGAAWWFDWPLEWDVDPDDEIEWPF